MQYVLEWSKKQNSFHIQPLEQTILRNMECFKSNTTHDYIILEIGNHDSICNIAECQRKIITNRSKDKKLNII